MIEGQRKYTSENEERIVKKLKRPTIQERVRTLVQHFILANIVEELSPYREGRMPSQQTEKQREVDEIRQDARLIRRERRAHVEKLVSLRGNDQSAS